MYAILGDIKFEGPKGFQDFSASNETVLSEHPVIEGKPKLQATGEKLEEISLKFLLHAGFCNPEFELERLQAYRRNKQVVPFVAGDGTSFGDFVVKSVIRTYQQTDNKGAIIGIDIEVTLVEVYTPPGVKKRSASDKLAVKEPSLSVTALPARLTDPQAITLNVRAINMQSTAMDQELRDAQRVGSKTARSLRQAKKRVDKIRDSLAIIETVGSNTRNVVNMFDDMRGQVDAVRSATDALEIFIQDGDLNSAVNASAQLRNQYGQLAVKSSPLSNLVGTRRDKEVPRPGVGTIFDFPLDGTFS
jgi:phage protein U